MKKLLTLLFAASLFVFVACEQNSESTAAEDSEQVLDGPAEDIQEEELQEEVVEPELIESEEIEEDHDHSEEESVEVESAE